MEDNNLENILSIFTFSNQTLNDNDTDNAVKSVDYTVNKKIYIIAITFKIYICLYITRPDQH